MNYKTCKRLNDNFVLDEKFDIFLAVRNNLSGETTGKVPVTDPMAKGYIYACLYFYDEVEKEVNKLRAMINRMLDEVNLEANIPEPAKKLMELSARARGAIGDDSLDAMIKEELAKEERAISLIPDAQEIEKLEKILDSIFTELFESFSMVTLHKTKDEGPYKTFRFTDEYIAALTERQKKLLAPAIRMIGFENSVKLNDFEVRPDWSVRYIPERLSENFEAKEEEIKFNLKQMMEKHLLQG